MGGSNSKKDGNKITAHDRAMLDLKNQRDKLQQYSKKLEEVMEKETNMAKELVIAGKRKQALLCLKKKRFQQSSLERAEGQLLNIEQVINSVEFAQLQKETFDRLAEGRDMLQAIQAEMDLDEIEQIMSDTKEAMEYQDRIGEALGSKLSNIDEEAIEEEFAALLAGKLPDAPSHELENPHDDKEVDKVPVAATLSKKRVAEAAS